MFTVNTWLYVCHLTCQTPAADPLSSRYESAEWRNAAKLRRRMWWRLWAKQPTGEYWSLAAALDLPFPTAKLSDTFKVSFNTQITTRGKSNYSKSTALLGDSSCMNMRHMHSCFLTFELVARSNSRESCSIESNLLNKTVESIHTRTELHRSVRSSSHHWTESLLNVTVLTHVNEIDMV